MNQFQKKISKILKMFEIIYSNRKQLNISLVRLWSLKKMKDRAKKYRALLDLPNYEKYVTKTVIRDIDYIYDVFETILSQMP
jgi:hypothetical protein